MPTQTSGSAMLLTLVGLILASHCSQGRPLSGAARKLKTDVTTTAVALDGGVAVANLAAQNGKHTKTVIAVGNHTMMHSTPAAPGKVTPSWEAAPTCHFAPTAGNAVKDESGRLWGWQDNNSCAFKQPLYHSGPTWEAAPPCPSDLSAANGTKDLSGRLWGWHNNQSCAFKDAITASVNTKTNESSVHGRRKLLAVSSNAIAVPSDATTGTTTLAISATEPLDTNTPADKLLHPTVAKAVVGSGSDVATCEHITIPDSDKGQQFTQLKCNPATPTGTAKNSTGASGDDETQVNDSVASFGTEAPPSAATSSSGDMTASNGVTSASNETNTDTSPHQSPENNTHDTGDVEQPDDTTAIVIPTTPVLTSDNNDKAHTVVNRFGATWEVAPACEHKPSKRTAVQDTWGRLWWWAGGISCAYKDANNTSIYYEGYAQVKWQGAPACKEQPTLINSMADAEDRLWGWQDSDGGQNCRFLDAHGKAVLHEKLLQIVVNLAASDSSERSP